MDGNKLKFDFEPKLLIIFSEIMNSSNKASYFGLSVFNAGVMTIASVSIGTSTLTDVAIITWAENSVSFYATSGYSQLNASGTEYYYVALG